MKTEFYEANILSATTDFKKHYDINIIYKTDDGFIINQHFCPDHFNKAYFRVSDNTFNEKDIQNVTPVGDYGCDYYIGEKIIYKVAWSHK